MSKTVKVQKGLSGTNLLQWASWGFLLTELSKDWEVTL